MLLSDRRGDLIDAFGLRADDRLDLAFGFCLVIGTVVQMQNIALVE